MPRPTKALQRAYQRRWMKKRRRQWVASKGGACVDCGSKKRICVQFPGGRTMVPWSFSAPKREAMLKDAFLRCRKCVDKIAVANRPKKPPKHGTENTYGRHRCRCDACRLAHRVFRSPHTKKPLRPYRPRPQHKQQQLQRLLRLLDHRGEQLARADIEFKAWLQTRLPKAERKARQDITAKATVMAVLAARGSLRVVTKPPPPTAFDLVRNLPESPACGDDIWNDLAEPLLFALMKAGTKGLSTGQAHDVVKNAGLPYHMVPDAIAWLHINNMAAWRRRRWYDPAVAMDACEDGVVHEGKRWRKRGKKGKVGVAAVAPVADDAPDASDAPMANDAADAIFSLELDGEIPGAYRLQRHA